MKRTARHGSVQDLLPLTDIVEGVLCLRGGEYRAVVEAQSVNFALRSEEEQEATMAGYRSSLNSLRHPIQVLVRILPTDVEPYLDGFRDNPTSRGSEAIRRLALEHETFVRRLTRERTLLERRFYIVVPAGEADSSDGVQFRLPWKRDSSRGEGQEFEVAAGRLAARCQEIAQGLAGFGVSSRRLENNELADLWADCLGSQVSHLSPSRGALDQPVIVAMGKRRAVRHD